MTMDPKKTELTSLFYSVGIHMIIVSFLLTLPISKGEVRLHSFSELIVYPQAERGDALPAAPPEPKAVVPRISYAKKVQIKALQKRDAGNVKPQGKGLAKDLALKKTPLPTKGTAKSAERREAVETKPVQTRVVEVKPVETKPVETKPVDVQLPQTAPVEEVPEVKEEEGTKLLTEEETPEALPPEGKREETEIEENTEREPDIAAKTVPAEEPPAPVIEEKSIKKESVSKVMPVQPKTKGVEAETKGINKGNAERKSAIAAKTTPAEEPPVPPIEEESTKQEIAGKMMPVQPKTKGVEAETKGDNSEKGLHAKTTAVGADKGRTQPVAEKGPPPSPTPSLLESFWQDIALSSTAPVSPPLRRGPPEVGTPAGRQSPGSTGKKIYAEQKPGTAGKETEGKKNKEGVARPGVGIPFSEALLSRGVRIVVLLDAGGDPKVEMRLVRKPYPSRGGRKTRQAQKEVAAIQEKEEMDVAGKVRVKRSFSVENAEKGIYTFVMDNKDGNAWEADLSFVFFKGGRKEKTKKYEAVKVSENGTVRFKFLFPDMIFWDDEDAFTGSIEDSDSLTKFNSDTGLLWKEEKNDSR
jgi:hypothetical protein